MTSLEKALLILLVIVSLSLNTFRLSSIPGGLHGDEAQHGLQAIEILEGKYRLLDFGWYGLPIPSFLAQAMGIWFFGKTIFALRISSAIIGSLTLIPFYYLIRLLFDRKTALFSAVFLATSHWWIAYSRLGENYIHVPFIAVVGLLLIVLGFRTKKLWLACLAGVVTGINFYLYFAARLTPILSCILLMYFVFTTKPKQSVLKILFAILIGFFVMYLPFLMVSMQQREVAFSRQNDVYIYGTGLGSRWRQETYGDRQVWDTIAGQFSKTFSLKSGWRDTSGQYGYRGWIVDPASGILLMLGFVGIVFIRAPGIQYFPLVWLMLTVFTGWILTENPPFSPRVVGAIPALAVLVGFGVNILNLIIRRFTSILRISLISICTICVIFYNLHAYFIRGVYEEWGDPNKYVATDIAVKMNRLSGYTIVFLTAPFIYADFGPIRYLASETKIVSVDQPISYQPIITHRTLFVLHPNYEFLLANIIALNPNGTIDRKISHTGTTQVIYYQVN
ncbi:MAG: glycosyltransferase family 39 protein [Candidatus Gottesmanbacteria bacterium]|nr:glycosyltransferase family 39 protein [Candidatus Gottesmanbacteria bacterium]